MCSTDCLTFALGGVRPSVVHSVLRCSLTFASAPSLHKRDEVTLYTSIVGVVTRQCQ